MLCFVCNVAEIRHQPILVICDVVPRNQHCLNFFRKLNLKHDEAAIAKSGFAGRQIEFAYPAETLVVNFDRFFTVGHEAFAPCFQCFGMAQRQNFKIPDIQPAPLYFGGDFRQGQDGPPEKGLCGSRDAALQACRRSRSYGSERSRHRPEDRPVSESRDGREQLADR